MSDEALSERALYEQQIFGADMTGRDALRHSEMLHNRHEITRRVVSEESNRSANTTVSASGTVNSPIVAQHHKVKAAGLQRHADRITSHYRKDPRSVNHQASPQVLHTSEPDTEESPNSPSITLIESPSLPSQVFYPETISEINVTRPLSSHFEEEEQIDPSDPSVWTADRVCTWLDKNAFGREWQESFLKHEIAHETV